MSTEKVLLVKTTKWGKEFKKAGDTIEVSPEQKKELLKRGIILDETAPVVTDDKGIEALKKEVETLKADKVKLEEELKTLKADKEPTEKDGKDDLLGKGK